jgi:fructose-1,6-bisphosphatase I
MYHVLTRFALQLRPNRALIIEQAGGIASTGLFEGKIQRVLELVPDSIHAKCPIVMGGKRDVQVLYDKYKAAGIDTPEL